MKVFGFETKDKNMDVFPQQRIVAEFNKMQGLIIEENPAKYRVVPNQSDNTFNIVCKENGRYKTIEKGFKTRVDAQSRIKEMMKMYQILLPKLKDHLKRKAE